MARKKAAAKTRGKPDQGLSADFVITGFPKCSTSALARFLERSPVCKLSKLPNSYESPYFMDSIPTPAPEYEPGLKNGHKFAAYIYAPHALARLYEDNPETLFIITVRPALPALLSWRKMHARIAERGAPGHFTTKDEQTRAFYMSSSADDYFAAFANTRLDYASHMEVFLNHVPDARYVIVSQARMAQDARGVVAGIHDLMGAKAPNDYLDTLPMSHATAGDKAVSSTPVSPETLLELQRKDERLKAFLSGLPAERKLLSDDEA